MYLTYAEYKALGGTLDATSYTLYEFKARAEIDWVTFNRLQKDTSFSEPIKMCMFAIIAELQKMDALSATVTMDSESSDATSASVASMSNDGVSLSYNQLSANDGLNYGKQAIQDTINKYLQGVTNELGRKLLYRGIYPDE